MTYPAALKALSTGPDNRPFSPTRQHGNETQGFFSRLLRRMSRMPCYYPYCLMEGIVAVGSSPIAPAMALNSGATVVTISDRSA